MFFYLPEPVALSVVREEEAVATQVAEEEVPATSVEQEVFKWSSG